MEFFALDELRRKSFSGRSRFSVAAEVLSEQATSDARNIFSGQEYLALYPRVIKKPSALMSPTLFICGEPGNCVRFDEWLKDEIDDDELDPIGRLGALTMRLPSDRPGVVIAYVVRPDGSIEYV